MMKRQRPGQHPSNATKLQQQVRNATNGAGYLPTTTSRSSAREFMEKYKTCPNSRLSQRLMPCMSKGRIWRGQGRILTISFAGLAVLACFWWISSGRPPQCTPNDSDSSRPQDICFVTCIFGNDIGEVDQPANVDWYAQNWCHTQFLLVTNLPTLPAKGWNKIVSSTETHSNNLIVQSREAKFLGWKALPNVQKDCVAVVYMDGYLQPKHNWWFQWQWPTTRDKFQAIVEQVHQHPWGLSQVKQAYFNGLSMDTILNNLVRDRKDTVEHVNATLSWLQKQEDYQPILTYYLNKYFAYDPNNVKYQELSSWFWQQYTSYGGLWRDQPLWAYTLHHFNVTPAVMTSKGTITKGGDLFETGGTLGWDKHIYV